MLGGGVIPTGTGRFGKDVSAKTFRQKKFETFRQIFHAETYRITLVPSYLGFVFGFLQTGPNQFVENQKQNQDYIPVCRILELKKNDKTINVGMMQSIKRASDLSPFS